MSESKSTPDAATNGSSSTDGVRKELYSQFEKALQTTKDEVKQMRTKLEEYDEKIKASETLKQQGAKASEYFHGVLEEIQAALDSVSERAVQMFGNVQEFSLSVFHEIMAAFKKAVEKLRALAIEFDEKYEISNKATALFAPLFARLQSVDQLKKSVKDMGEQSRSFLINTAANLDNKFDIENKLNQIDEKYKVAEKAKTIQEKGAEFIEKHHIRENLEGLDERFTGSKAGEYIEEGVKILTKEWEKIHDDYRIARKNSKENLSEAAPVPQATS